MDREAEVPLGTQLAWKLRRLIETGELGAGDRLPSVRDAAAAAGVNVNTVRSVYGRLESEGLVSSEQGRGTFVQEAVIDYQVSRKTRFSENLSRQNRTSGRVLLSTADLPATTEVARALRLRRGAMVAYVLCAGETDGRRISVSAHYFPKPRFDGIGALMAETKSFTQSVKKLGVDDYIRQTTRVLAKMPTTEEARLLSMPRNRPLIVTEGLNVDGQGNRIEFCLTKFVGDLVQVLVEH